MRGTTTLGRARGLLSKAEALLLFIMEVGLSLLSTGCVRRYLEVTYHSIPDGATLLQNNGSYVGSTPKILYYELTAAECSKGNIRVAGLTAHWADGTQQTASPSFSVKPVKGDGLSGTFNEIWKVHRSYTFIKPQMQSARATEKPRTVISSTGHTAVERAEARAEYEQALSAYNQAMQKLDNERLGHNIVSLPVQHSNAFNAAIGVLAPIATSQAVAAAERDLAVARERLERAKARMNASDWQTLDSSEIRETPITAVSDTTEQHVIVEGDKIRPAPGYMWADPRSGDKRVVKIPDNVIFQNGGFIRPLVMIGLIRMILRKA